MTEPVPTDYDIIQDDRLDALDDLIHPYYQPPGEQEYSFPVVGQGVSSEMFQQISRAAGTGVFVQGDEETAQSPYRLVGMPGGDSETNATNQMRLRVPTNTGRSEAAMSGFFHTQTQDMVISLPAVSTPTTYRVCLTYDPRREEEESGPIRVEVHPGPPPTTHGRTHIVLWTVHREPNQLLTDATITQTRHWLGHVINVWSYDQLPDPTTTELGVLAVVLYREGTTGTDPEIYTNRGVHGWVRVNGPRQYAPVRFMNDWGNFSSSSTDVKFTLADGIVHVSGFMKAGHWGTSRDIMQLPAAVTPTNTVTLAGLHASFNSLPFYFRADGYVSPRSLNNLPSGWVCLDGLSYPINN